MKCKLIETAPKDGREIMVWSNAYGGRWTFARWDDDKYSKKPRQRWVSNCGGYGRTTLLDSQPTHWMPLPPPPVNDENTPIDTEQTK